jgi:succinate dehydrogenase / fumarate reductase cytochrome b subunit
MSWFFPYIRSSVGAKHLMAITGGALVLFAIAHMIGHFGVFAGQDAYNSYAAFLQGLGALKWIVRGGLLAAVLLHIVAAVRLTVLNQKARPVKYQVYRPRRATPWGRAMAWSGLVVLAFIIFHLLHFTFGSIQHDNWALVDEQGRPDAYSMLVLGFQHVPVAVSYIVAMALLMAHLAHGISSTFQSLGLRHPKYDRYIELAGPALALVLFVGYCSTPVAVLAGIVDLPGV